MSVQPDEIRRHLQRVLADEARLLAQLEQILTAEAAVVGGSDATAIEHIGAARHRCIASLTGLDAERVSTCRMLAYAPGREGFERLLGWCDPSAALHERWRQNLQLAHRCKDLNDRNGLVVSLKLGQVQKRLAALRGGSAGALYGRGGARIDGFAPRALGTA